MDCWDRCGSWKECSDGQVYNTSGSGEFNRQVWEIVSQVPAGKVTTYGFIAGLIPPPGGMDPAITTPGERAGWAAPWQLARLMSPGSALVNAQGKISLRPGGGGQDQRQLLEAEGRRVFRRRQDRPEEVRLAGTG